MKHHKSESVIINLNSLDSSNLVDSDSIEVLDEIKKNGMNIFLIYREVYDLRDHYLGAVYNKAGNSDSFVDYRYLFKIYDKNILGTAPDGEYECIYLLFNKNDEVHRVKCRLEDGHIRSIYNEEKGWMHPDFHVDNELVCVYSAKGKVMFTKSNKIDVRPGKLELEESLFQ